MRRSFAALAVLSGLVGCSTHTTSVIPKECPEATDLVLFEEADMEMKGLYPNTVSYLQDGIWPYCRYIGGLRGDPE